MASGVVVCWRTRRSASWFSAGVQSSSQNRSYGSSALPSLAAWIGRHPVVAVVQQRQFRAELVADGLEDGGQVAQVGAGVPVLFCGNAPRPAGS